MFEAERATAEKASDEVKQERMIASAKAIGITAKAERQKKNPPPLCQLILRIASARANITRGSEQDDH